MNTRATETYGNDSRLPISSAGEASRPDARRVSVQIVDGDGDSSYSLWALLRWHSGIRVCATAASSAAATVVRQERPAVCLVPASLGPRRIHQIAELVDPPRVLVYTDRRTPELDGMAVLAGADGVLWRYVDSDELADTIRRVAARLGRPMDLAPEAIDRLIDLLDDRDRPIASMLLLGTPLDEIARILGISAGAVRARRSAMVTRLDGGLWDSAPTATRATARAGEP